MNRIGPASGPNLAVELAGLVFKSPVMPASGCFNYGREFAHIFDLSRMGAITNKTVMPEPRKGNPPQRVFERRAAMLNAIGIPGKGPQHFLEVQLPFMRSLGTNVIVNIGAMDKEGFAELAALISAQEGVHALELNLSCPNVEKEPFALSERGTAKIVEAVRKRTNLPIIAKLAPNVTSITKLARAALNAGADALCIANAYPAMAIDLETRRPVLGHGSGGFSGPAVKPLILRLVWEVVENLDAPVIACGGVTTAEDALEYLLAGARVVQVGTANFTNPYAIPSIIDGIERYLREHGIPSVASIIGAAHGARTSSRMKKVAHAG